MIALYEMSTVVFCSALAVGKSIHLYLYTASENDWPILSLLFFLFHCIHSVVCVPSRDVSDARRYSASGLVFRSSSLVFSSHLLIFSSLLLFLFLFSSLLSIRACFKPYSHHHPLESLSPVQGFSCRSPTLFLSISQPVPFIILHRLLLSSPLSLPPNPL